MRDDAPLAVAYDEGSVSPAEIAIGLADLGPVVFLLPSTPHVRRLRTVLAGLGRVLLLTGDPRRDLLPLRRLAPAGILTFSENLLTTTADLAHGLGLPFHTPATARLLTDKPAQRERLRTAGVDGVRHHPVDGPEQWWPALTEVGLPAVVKPARGQGSRATHLVPDRAAAAHLYSELFEGTTTPPGRIVVEELLVGRPSAPFGDYVSVETASGPHGTEVLAVTGKHPLAAPFREQGQFWPSALPPAECRDVAALAVRAVRALGVSVGICHTEIKLTASGPRIIEVNGRLGGHLNELARRACGTDLVHTAGLLARGGTPDHGRLHPDRVYFQFNAVAPTTPGELREVQGADEVREIPGITGYRSYVRPGDRLDGGVGSTFLDLLTGDATDHDGMTTVLDRALAVLSYGFRPDGADQDLRLRPRGDGVAHPP